MSFDSVFGLIIGTVEASTGDTGNLPSVPYQVTFDEARGCITGKVLKNLREKLEDSNKPGTYLWDYLDGYDDDDKSSLRNHPDMQEKVRRVITQGFIDPEDFNGVNSFLFPPFTC
jgi:hypothetical protein